MGKGLIKLIEHKKTAIVKEWFDLAIQPYEPETAKFIKGQKDHFANPVGSNTLKGLEGLLDQLLKDPDRNAINAHLDPIIRIRAVQALSPSQATAFIFSLKKVLRTILDKELQGSEIAQELIIFESRIDQLGLMAFDIYSRCREKVHQIGANETSNRIFRAFERAGLISEVQENRPKIKKTIN